ncbi:MAG: amino acid ABC transporter ATP-binding protein [Alphaproteobacteria bacterium]
MEEVLRVEDLHKFFGPLEVLRGVDLTVHKGETIVILGSSGSGKSTLLRCINLLEIPTSGRIHLNGQPVGRSRTAGDNAESIHYPARELSRVRAQVGMVFQHFNLFPHMTALENVMEGPRTVLRLSKAESTGRAIENLVKVGLEEKASEHPARLSGGQQQRVAIARALAMKPTVMLFDEVTSALDPELVGEVLRTMRGLSNEGMTMLVVTHEIGFAYAVADRVIFIHDGKIHEQGRPDDVLVRPQRQRTREFIAGFTQFRVPDLESDEA